MSILSNHFRLLPKMQCFFRIENGSIKSIYFIANTVGSLRPFQEY